MPIVVMRAIWRQASDSRMAGTATPQVLPARVYISSMMLGGA
jgi:hypothetical protein